MPSTDAPNWWADVQQEREDLAGRGRRPAEDWLGEDIDFVPRRRMARAQAQAAPIARRATAADATLERRPVAELDRRASADVSRRASADVSRRASAEVSHRPDADFFGADDPYTAAAEHPLHGVFVPTASHAPVREAVATARTFELTTSDGFVPVAAEPSAMAHELAHLSAADDPFATPPPPAGARRTVQIKGRPTESRLASVTQRSMAQRHRGRTTSDRVGHRPDRIALWAVALGAVLILLAAMTSSSQAAVRHAKTSAPAVAAKVAHAAPHASPRAPFRAQR
jgi:hypothetical protein